MLILLGKCIDIRINKIGMEQQAGGKVVVIVLTDVLEEFFQGVELDLVKS